MCLNELVQGLLAEYPEYQAGLFATLLGKLKCGEPWLLLFLCWHHCPTMEQLIWDSLGQSCPCAVSPVAQLIPFIPFGVRFKSKGEIWRDNRSLHLSCNFCSRGSPTRHLDLGSRSGSHWATNAALNRPEISETPDQRSLKPSQVQIGVQ